MNIGSLTGVVSIEDQVTGKLTSIISRVQSFAESFDGAFGAIAIGAGVAVTAIAGIAASVVSLGEKGSTILGVEESFDRLAKTAGTTGDILINRLSKGVHGTVDSMELMTATSKALSAGVRLTGDDMETLGETARALGKASGTDAAHGVEMLSNALVTGRTRSLAMAGVVVDVKGAEDKLAASLGITAAQLNNAGKLQAARTAIMEAARHKLDQLGVSETSFKEKIQAGQVAIGNWFDTLAKSVASSPQVNRALDTIGEAIIKAFGGGAQTMLQTIVGWVNRFADAVTRYGPPVIQALADIWQGVVHVWHEVQNAWDWIPEWFKEMAKYSAVAAGGLVLVKGATDAAAEGLLSTVASFATITSGSSDMVKALAGVPRLMAAVSSSTIGMALAQGEFSIALGLTTIGLTSAATAAAPFLLAAAEIVVIVGAISGALWIGITAWDNWKASQDRARQTNDTMLQEQLNLISINKQYGQSFTDAAKAAKFANEQVQKSRATAFMGPPQSAADEAANAGARHNQDLIDRAELAKKAAAAEKKYVEDATKHEALLAAEYSLTTEAYTRSIDKRLAADAGWREEQNKRGLAAMEAERKLLSDQGVAERAALNERNVAKMNAEAAQMALEVKNAELERSLLNDLNVDKMNAEAKLLEGTKGHARATSETWLREYNRIKDDSSYTAEAVTAAWQRYVDSTEGQAIKVVRNWTEAWKGVKSGLSAVLDSIPQTVADALTGGGGILGAAKAIGSQVGSVIGKGIGTAIGGKLGGQIGEAVGSLVGPLIDAFAKVFDHVGKDIKRLGRNLGVKLSDGLIEQIRADAKKFGGEVQGLLVNLSKVISEAGGLNAGNLELFTGKLHDVFSLIETHQLTVAAGTKILDDNFQAFATAGTNSLGLLDKKLRDIIVLNDIVGTQSRAIADYVAGQATAAQNGFTTALGVTSAAYKTLAALQVQAKTATGSALDEINAKMLVQQKIIDATVVHSQAAATAVSASIIGTIAANMQAGMSFAQAIAMVAPAIEGLEAQLKVTGFSGGAAFDLIREQVALAHNEIAGPALESIHGWTAGLVGLSNAGLLNQETFAGLASQVSATEKALLAQGFSASAVSLAMQSDLQTIWELQQNYGYSVDDTTQALVDQAVADGIVGEKHKSSTQQMIDASNRMVDVLEAMATFMGVTLPAAAKMGASGVQSELDKIRTPSLPEPWRDWGAPPDYSGNDAAAGMAGGGIVYAAGGFPAIPHGSDTVPAMLTPGESVRTVAQTKFDADQNRTIEIHLEVEGRELARASVPYIPGELRARGIR